MANNIGKITQIIGAVLDQIFRRQSAGDQRRDPH